jgi:soluble lytic murein transglycosylase-like protein
MSSLWRRLLIPCLLLLLFCIGTALGQSGLVLPDPFQQTRASLSAAADRTLAATLADRPWMKPARAPASSTPAAITPDNTVQRLRAGIERVQQLRPVIAPILREEGVPPELLAVALVESGGQPTALSPKGARGVWQFMPDTARRYGLTVTAVRDDRLDLVKSTHAAARYLRDLHRQFGDWPLAFAAYNAGERAVEQVMRRAGQRTFASVRSLLPPETRRYVPAVVSVMPLFGQGSEAVEVNGAPAYSASSQVLYASPEQNSNEF